MISKKLYTNLISPYSGMKTTIHVFLLSLIAISCTDPRTEKKQFAEIEKLQSKNDSLNKIITEESAMKHRIITSLTFQKNDAEQAMNFYVSLFDDSEIIDVQRWGKDGPGKEGTIMQAVFELAGRRFICSDSPPVHDWDFSPAVSVLVECKNEEEIERLFSKLSENGTVAMPIDDYGFSRKFGWVIDPFGVSWQLNLQ